MDAVAESGEIPCVRTRFSLSLDNEQAGAGRDGWTHLARPYSQARMGTEKTRVFFPFSCPRAGLATIPPVDPYSAECADHTYIHTTSVKSYSSYNHFPTLDLYYQYSLVARLP